MKIPFNRPFIAGKELNFIAQSVLVNSHLSGNGPFTKLCTRWLEDRLKCGKVLLTHSCTASLEMAAILCNIQPGDEIIMPSFTFVSTANAFVLRGGRPVFIDIKDSTLNMDETLIEKAITSKTKAIVPVHYAGCACAMDDIMDIANKYGLWVVEDAAQAIMSSYNSRYLGTIGHIGCLSFHETKNIISGEGGALLLNNENLVDRAEIIWEKGTDRNKFYRGEVDKYTWVDIGSSYLPSELVAAFLFAQLEHADNIIEKRISIYKKYRDKLRTLVATGNIKVPNEQDGNSYNGHIFYILTKSLDERNNLLKYLNNCNVNAVFHYVPLHSSPAGRKFCRLGSTMDITNNISNRLIRLPMYYEMTGDDVDLVVATIERFYS